MKNWLPLVLAPALAMDTEPSMFSRLSLNSSSNASPHTLSPPVPSPVGVAALNHEVFNDAVEGQAVVVAFQGMDFKVVHGLGGLVREKAELDDLARLHGDDSDFLPFLGISSW